MSEELSEKEQREVVSNFRTLREDIDVLYRKLAEVDGDRSEHDVVIKQLSLLGGDRRCWNQVGGVLVERTVGEVLPTIQENRKQLVKVVKTLTVKIEEKEKELSKLQKKYNIREISAGPRAVNLGQ